MKSFPGIDEGRTMTEGAPGRMQGCVYRPFFLLYFGGTPAPATDYSYAVSSSNPTERNIGELRSRLKAIKDM